MDEVEGRRPVAVKAGAASKMHCNTCPGVQARSFCVDCHEYLCTDCTGYHQRLNALKSHTLLMGDKFPTVEPPQRQDKAPDTFVTCPDHPKEEIKFYCQRHDALCCHACSVINHEHCTKAYIPEIAKDFKSGPEFSALNTNIQDTDNLIVKRLDDVKNCLKAVDALKVGEINKLRKYKAEIIEYLDRREKELLCDMQLFRDEDVTLLTELQGKLNTYQSVLNDMKMHLKSHEKNSTALFISAKRASVQMINLLSSLQEIKIGYQRYSILRDTGFETILRDKAGFAGVELIYEMSSAKLKQQLSIQLKIKTCDVSHLVPVSTNNLHVLMSMNEQSKVTLVDIRSGQLLHEIKLQGKPWAVCMTSANLAATTLDNKTIQFMQVNETTLKMDSTMKVDVDVVGIAAHGDNLVVTHAPPGVRIISKDGAVIHSLNNELAKREIFKAPLFIATTSDGFIYISDMRLNKITRLDPSLKILQTFSGPMLNVPRGIISLNRDQLLVCSRNTIAEIRPSINSMADLMRKEERLESPLTLCFFSKQKNICVASATDKGTGKILVYNLE